jgi:hypothetical protein
LPWAGSPTARDRAALRLTLRSLEVGPNSPQLRRYTSQSDNSTSRGVRQREPCLSLNTFGQGSIAPSFPIWKMAFSSLSFPVKARITCRKSLARCRQLCRMLLYLVQALRSGPAQILELQFFNPGSHSSLASKLLITSYRDLNRLARSNLLASVLQATRQDLRFLQSI